MINGTFFLQIFHFFVAYLLLKYILLRPALAVVLKQEERELQVNHDIVLLKNTVAHAVQSKKEKQAVWLQKIATIKPVLTKAPAVEQPHLLAEHASEIANEQKIVQQAVQSIVTTLGEGS